MSCPAKAEFWTGVSPEINESYSSGYGYDTNDNNYEITLLFRALPEGWASYSNTAYECPECIRIAQEKRQARAKTREKVKARARAKRKKK